MTVQTAGIYLIGGSCSLDGNASQAQRRAEILLNGATTIGMGHELPGTSANTMAVSVETVYSLAVNDYVELRLYQESGASLNCMTLANYSPQLWMFFIGP